MGVEIERKFLVKSSAFKKDSFQKIYIKQGFLNSDKERTVRIRVTGGKGFITVKGKSNKAGTTRFEWEKEISLSDTNKLLSLCESGIIEKYRYLVKHGHHQYEVDEFYGDNKGLIVAEVELSDAQEVFEKPHWLSKEVTGIAKYYNSKLSKFPYKNWKK